MEKQTPLSTEFLIIHLYWVNGEWAAGWLWERKKDWVKAMTKRKKKGPEKYSHPAKQNSSDKKQTWWIRRFTSGKTEEEAVRVKGLCSESLAWEMRRRKLKFERIPAPLTPFSTSNMGKIYVERNPGAFMQPYEKLMERKNWLDWFWFHLIKIHI